MILTDNGKILMSPDGKVYSGDSGGSSGNSSGGLQVIDPSQFNPEIYIEEEKLTIVLDEKYENKCIKLNISKLCLEKGIEKQPTLYFILDDIPKNFKMFFDFSYDENEGFFKYIEFSSKTILNIRENANESSDYFSFDYYDNNYYIGYDGYSMCGYVINSSDLSGGFYVEIDELRITKIIPFINGAN